MSVVYLNRVRKQYEDRDDELIAAAAKVADLLNSEGWRLLQELVHDQHLAAQARLFDGHAGGSGKALEQAEYARLCGYLAGLLEPLNAARAYQDAVARLTESPE